MFETIRPATAGLILGAMFNVIVLSLFNVELYKNTRKFLDLFQVLQMMIFVGFLIALRKYEKIHPIIIIAIGAVLGIFFKL